MRTRIRLMAVLAAAAMAVTTVGSASAAQADTTDQTVLRIVKAKLGENVYRLPSCVNTLGLGICPAKVSSGVCIR